MNDPASLATFEDAACRSRWWARGPVMLWSLTTSSSEATSMTDVTLTDPVQVLSGVLSDPAAMLFGLEDEFGVLAVQRSGPSTVKVIIEQIRPGGTVSGLVVCSARR